MECVWGGGRGECVWGGGEMSVYGEEGEMWSVYGEEGKDVEFVQCITCA